MSEQYKQDAGSNNSEVEDDPLAELARIVSGEPEPSYMAQAEPEVSQPENASSIEDDVQASLEQELMREFSQDLSDAENIEQPAFIDEINASVEEMVAEQPEALNAQPVDAELNQESVVPEAAIIPEQAEYAEPVQAESMFQDDLISALENELTGTSPEETEPVSQVASTVDEIAPDEPVYEETATQSVEEIDPIQEFEIEASNIQATLEQEMSAEFAQQDLQPDVLEEEIVAPAIDADLGAEFASQFQQMNEQPTVEVEAPFVAPVVDEPEVLAPIDNEIIQEPVVSEDISDDLEASFEAAFAQELEVTAPQETQGFQEVDTTVDTAIAATVADESFVAPTSPQMPNDELVNMEPVLETVEYDPGHVGSVDDIAHVDEGLVAANENKGGKKYAVAALVLALFAGAIAAGYGFLGSDTTTVASGTPEIIKAENDPVKVKPENPGGVVPENQNNASYVDLGGTNTAEVSQDILNSQTEEPLVLNTGPSADATKTDDRLAPSQDEGATPNAASSSVLPKVVQTVVVKPDGTIISQPAAPKPVETVANTISSAANVAIKPVETQVIKKPESIDGAQATGNLQVPTASPLPKPVVKPQPVQQTVAVAPKPAPPKPAPAPTTRKSEWVVQVSSQRSAEAAQQSFNTMRNRFSALQGRAMSIQRANVNGATYFRVRVQTSSRADAGQLCSNISAAGGSCFVTK